MREDERRRLESIAERIARVRSWTEGVDEAQFLVDPMRADAVTLSLLAIAEMARQLGKDTLKRAPEVPWSSIVDAQRRIAPSFQAVDHRLAWATAKNDLPAAAAAIERLLAEAGAHASRGEAAPAASRAEPRGKPQVVVYTDGACSGNPGPGGWGAILSAKGRKKELSGGEPVTTNNRMELMGAIAALEALKVPSKVELHTDSMYLKDGITKWLPKWKRNGWRTATKQPVKNEDLWRRLDTAAARHEIDWRWVKGHNGDPGNERADELAREAIREMRRAKG